MSISTLPVVVPTKTAQLVIIGDPHYGSTEQDRKKIKKSLEYVKNTEDCYVVSIGDTLDMNLANGGYGFVGKDKGINQALDEFATDFRDLAYSGKLLGVLEGNHDTRLCKVSKTHANPLEALINEWRYASGQTAMVYANTSLLLDFRVGKNTGHSSRFTGLLTHGTGGGGSAGAVANKLINMRNSVYDADFYAIGHYHKTHIFYENLRGISLDSHVSGTRKKTQTFIAVGGHAVEAEYAEKMCLRSSPNYDALITMTTKDGTNPKKLKAELF